jgi:hypothetical protein
MKGVSVFVMSWLLGGATDFSGKLALFLSSSLT